MEVQHGGTGRGAGNWKEPIRKLNLLTLSILFILLSMVDSGGGYNQEGIREAAECCLGRHDKIRLPNNPDFSHWCPTAEYPNQIERGRQFARKNGVITTMCNGICCPSSYDTKLPRLEKTEWVCSNPFYAAGVILEFDSVGGHENLKPKQVRNYILRKAKDYCKTDSENWYKGNGGTTPHPRRFCLQPNKYKEQVVASVMEYALIAELLHTCCPYSQITSENEELFKCSEGVQLRIYSDYTQEPAQLATRTMKTVTSAPDLEFERWLNSSRLICRVINSEAWARRHIDPNYLKPPRYEHNEDYSDDRNHLEAKLVETCCNTETGEFNRHGCSKKVYDGIIQEIRILAGPRENSSGGTSAMSLGYFIPALALSLAIP